jgi:hypothetical protein
MKLSIILKKTDGIPTANANSKSSLQDACDLRLYVTSQCESSTVFAINSSTHICTAFRFFYGERWTVAWFMQLFYLQNCISPPLSCSQISFLYDSAYPSCQLTILQTVHDLAVDSGRSFALHEMKYWK